ncbi:MAG TPA: DUF1559 domain-containing protein, partial [Lacipirellula sp.]
WSNYHANAGSWVRMAREWDGVFGPYDPESKTTTVGGKPQLPPVPISRIIDGTSHTAAFAEIANGYGNDSGSPKDPKADCFERPGVPTSTREAARANIAAANWQTSNVPWSNAWRWRGYPWSEGTMWRSWYNHLLPPNANCWKPCTGDGCWWDLISPPNSYHNGVVNVVMCDGSVQSVADDIDVEVWLENGTRDGVIIR